MIRSQHSFKKTPLIVLLAVFSFFNICAAAIQPSLYSEEESRTRKDSVWNNFENAQDSNSWPIGEETSSYLTINLIPWMIGFIALIAIVAVYLLSHKRG